MCSEGNWCTVFSASCLVCWWLCVLAVEGTAGSNAGDAVHHCLCITASRWCRAAILPAPCMTKRSRWAAAPSWAAPSCNHHEAGAAVEAACLAAATNSPGQRGPVSSGGSDDQTPLHWSSPQIVAALTL